MFCTVQVRTGKSLDAVDSTVQYVQKLVHFPLTKANDKTSISADITYKYVLWGLTLLSHI